MPNDLYRWEGTGSLVHHCPQCYKPLTVPQARTRCLGEHVEWCKAYHTQLFKKGTSSTCDPCRRTDEEHLKRHREIAELLLELKQIKAAKTPDSPLTPKTINTVLPHYTTSPLAATESPMTKKERKALKRARKILDMPKVVNTADVEFVATVFHSNDENPSDEDIDLERQLLEDPEIKLNRFFHKGTSNRREVRMTFVKKTNRHAPSNGEEELRGCAEEVDGLLQLLDVSPVTTGSTAEDKAVHSKLKACVEKELLHTRKETETMMMRKAGFWRWASKKAYNRLVQNGRIWGQKEYDYPLVSAKADDADGSSTPTSGEDVDGTDESTEADTDITAPSDGMSIGEVPSVSLPPDTEADVDTPITPNTTNNPIHPADDDGWTTVGKPSKIQQPVGNLKLVSNGGLGKMALAVRASPVRRGWAVFYD